MMTNEDSEHWNRQRQRLNFAHVVEMHFDFLRNYGFSLLESSPTIVRFKNADLQVNVFHGRRSHEIGIQMVHGDEEYSLGALIKLRDPSLGDRYRRYMASTPEDVVAGVRQLSELVKEFGDSALRGDPATFAALADQRALAAEALEQRTIAHQIRPKAEAAFRSGRYQDAVSLYEQMRPSLTPTELKKLAFAKDRASR